MPITRTAADMCRTTAVLVLLLTGLTQAEDEHPTFKKEYFAEHIGEMTLGDAGVSYAFRMNHPVLGPDTLMSRGKANWQKGNSFPPDQSATLGLDYLPESDDAQRLFAHMMTVWDVPGLTQKVRANPTQRLVNSEIRPDRGELIIHVRGQGYTGTRRLIEGPYILTILAGGRFSSDEAFRALFDEIESLAYAAIRKAGGKLEDQALNLSIEHIHPFETNVSPDRRPGDIIVTLTDAKGQPLAHRDIILHVPDDSPERPIFGFAPNPLLRPAADALPKGVNRKNWTRLSTDAHGKARMNYLKGPSVLYHWNLSLTLDTQWHQGQTPLVKRTIEAVLLNVPLGEAYRDGMQAAGEVTESIVVSYDRIAQIYEVGTQSETNTPNPRVEVAHKYFADVQRMPAGVLDKPFPLRGEDEIRIYAHGRVAIRWLNNLDMWVAAKRSHLESNEYAIITICPTRPTILRWLDMKMDKNWVGLCFTGGGVYLSMASNPYATAIGGALGVVSFVWGKGSDVWDPLSIQLESHLAMSLGETTEAWTLEGRIMLDNRDGQAVALPADQKTLIDAQGPRPPTAFTREELPTDVLAFIEAHEQSLEKARLSAADGRSARQRQSDGSGTTVIVIVVIAALVVAGAGGWVLWRRRAA